MSHELTAMILLDAALAPLGTWQQRRVLRWAMDKHQIERDSL